MKEIIIFKERKKEREKERKKEKRKKENGRLENKERKMHIPRDQRMNKEN